MTLALLIIIALLVLGLTYQLYRRRPRTVPGTAPSDHRILFPFVAHALSHRALNAAFRLAAAEHATVVPVFLARVPLHLPLDSPIPRQTAIALPIQEAIEQKGTKISIPIDSRIERGRTHRHALKRSIAHERYDRIVIAAATRHQPGFEADDIAWVLTHARGEIVVLRPADDEPQPQPHHTTQALETSEKVKLPHRSPSNATALERQRKSIRRDPRSA